MGFRGQAQEFLGRIFPDGPPTPVAVRGQPAPTHRRVVNGFREEILVVVPPAAKGHVRRDEEEVDEEAMEDEEVEEVDLRRS